MPLLAVPGLHGPAGLPVGLQLVGRRDRDLELVAVGAHVAARVADRS